MNVKFIQKVLVFTILIICFMMGCCSFNQILWFKEHVYSWVYTWINDTQTGQTTTWNKTTTINRTVIVNKSTNTNKISEDRSYQETNTWWSKLVLGAVSAWYDGETIFERVRNRLIYIWVDTWTSDFITWKCFDTAINPKHCVKSVVWISTSESSLFKRCKDNNCMWLKPSWELKWYYTLNLALDDWINRYNKYRYKNDSGKDWIIRSHYCKWDCSDLSDWWSNRTRAFDWAVNKLWI